jgi:hypothetical protein
VRLRLALRAGDADEIEALDFERHAVHVGRDVEARVVLEVQRRHVEHGEDRLAADASRGDAPRAREEVILHRVVGVADADAEERRRAATADE